MKPLITEERINLIITIFSESDTCSIMSAEATDDIYECLRAYQQYRRATTQTITPTPSPAQQR